MYSAESVQKEKKEKAPPVANGRTESHAGSNTPITENMRDELQIGFERISPREIKRP